MKTLKYLFPLFSLVLPLSSRAQGDISLTFGSNYHGSSNTASIFANEAKVGYGPSNSALLAIGYFPKDFDVAAAASAQSFEPILSTFRPLFATDFFQATAPGFFTSGKHIESQPEGTGMKAYLLVLGGVSSWESRSSASELGLYSGTALQSIPAGTSPTPSDFWLRFSIPFIR